MGSFTGTFHIDGEGTDDHDELTNVTADQHHAKSHVHDGADGSGTVSHDDLTDVSANDHHPQAHTHPAEGAVVVTHASTTGQTPNDHHAEDHDHDGSPTQKLTQANTHESADTDSAPTAIHHTLGTGANQSAAGNHAHATDWAETGDITSIDNGDASSGGALDEIARGDHQHGLAANFGLVPTGTWVPYAGLGAAPAGWLRCNGTAVSRVTYANLFNAITLLFTGDTTSGSNQITNVAAGLDIPKEAQLEGAGIPTGATVVSYVGTTITMSSNATATASGVSIRAMPHGDGDGATTFDLPNPAERYLRGEDLVGNFPMGGNGGVASHSHSLSDHVHAGPSHSHSGPSHTHTGPSHTHGVGTLDSAAGGDHDHGGNTGGPSDSVSRATGGVNTVSTVHTHTIAASGTHDHALSGSTAADGTGNTGAGGTASTGNAGTGDTSGTSLSSTSTDGIIPPFLTARYIIKT